MVVVDESALRRPVGSREIVREQLKYLAEMAEHPAVTLQILPFATGAHPAMGGAFTILRSAEPDVANVVYIEQLTRALYLDKSAEVEAPGDHESAVPRAESAASTGKLLQQILSDI